MTNLEVAGSIITTLILALFGAGGFFTIRRGAKFFNTASDQHDETIARLDRMEKGLNKLEDDSGRTKDNVNVLAKALTGQDSSLSVILDKLNHDVEKNSVTLIDHETRIKILESINEEFN